MVLWNCGHPANEGVSLDMINAEGGAFLYVSIHRSTACFLLSWSKLVLQCCLFNIRLECVICTNMTPVECFKAPLLVDQGRLAHRRDPLRLELPRRVVPGHGEGGQAATRRHSLHGGCALPQCQLKGELLARETALPNTDVVVNPPGSGSGTCALNVPHRPAEMRTR
jgi:hypothetical protein